MQIANGNLTIIFSSDTLKCYWKGVEVTGIERFHVHHDEDESRIKMVVSGTQSVMYQEMLETGINIKVKL
jgi:hypothetical protein